MAEIQPSKSDMKRERQPISIPFIWEEKPGTPKRDWTPTARHITPCPPPVKLVVSVPFGWEQKPGTPLHSLVHTPQEHDIIFSSPPKYQGDGLSDSESDTCSFKTGDAFSSPTTALSTADPVQSPGSPASETDGTSFLEWLFPLLAPNSKFPNKIGNLENDPSSEADVQDKEFVHESNCSQVRRPLLTLGELIVMSQRRSCQRKVTRMHKQPSMDFMKRNAWGCFTFGSGNGIGGLRVKWKRQLQLKLM